MTRIKLDPMSKDDYSKYQEDNMRRYALEGVNSGRWEVEESLKESRNSIDELLPKGMKTKNNFFFNIVNEEMDEKVGVLWLAIQDKTMTKSIFIFDILIFDRYQNKGLGMETMKEIEIWAKEKGAKAIWLHAFWHNQRAIALYKRLGYAESGVTMTKKLNILQP
jgi:RimJ/RimL family protein N-acetyltransferase